jgi:hypothetical protein
MPNTIGVSSRRGGMFGVSPNTPIGAWRSKKSIPVQSVVICRVPAPEIFALAI